WSHVNAPLLLQNAKVLQVDPGTTLTRVLYQLEQEGLLRGADDVLLYVKLGERSARLQAGEYELVAGLSVLGLLDLLASGKIITHQVSIIEGWTLRQALQAIQAHPAITATLSADDTTALQEAFGTAQYPEGLVFPDTYHFNRGTTD